MKERRMSKTRMGVSGKWSGSGSEGPLLQLQDSPKPLLQLQDSPRRLLQFQCSPERLLQLQDSPKRLLQLQCSPVRLLQVRLSPVHLLQVQYSLVHRTPERNGVSAACEDLGVRLLAYSPLGQGLLSGGYR